MRLDRLHRAYPSLHPSGVVHWVPVLSNIKTATGCESNRQLQLWTVFAGTVVYNYQFTVFKDGLGSYVKQVAGLSSSEWLKKSFETHPSMAVSQWSISSFIHPFIHNVMPLKIYVNSVNSTTTTTTTEYILYYVLIPICVPDIAGIGRGSSGFLFRTQERSVTAQIRVKFDRSDKHQKNS